MGIPRGVKEAQPPRTMKKGVKEALSASQDHENRVKRGSLSFPEP